jgi:hypothetical protein
MSVDLASAYLQDIIRTYRNYRILGERALAQVPDDRLHTRLDSESNSLAILVQHLAGNLRSRFTQFLTTDGEKPGRDRDAEFEMPAELTRDALVAQWNAAWDIALASIEALTPEDLTRTVTIRREDFLVLEALDRLAAHAAYHVGQIVLLAKHFAGPDWRTLSIPRRQSAAYSRGTFKDGIVHKPS